MKPASPLAPALIAPARFHALPARAVAQIRETEGEAFVSAHVRDEIR